MQRRCSPDCHASSSCCRAQGVHRSECVRHSAGPQVTQRSRQHTTMRSGAVRALGRSRCSHPASRRESQDCTPSCRSWTVDAIAPCPPARIAAATALAYGSSSATACHSWHRSTAVAATANRFTCFANPCQSRLRHPAASPSLCQGPMPASRPSLLESVRYLEICVSIVSYVLV